VSDLSLPRRDFIKNAGKALLGVGASVALPHRVFARAGATITAMEPLPPELVPNIGDRKVPVSLGILIDASNSIENPEFDMQVRGTASALRSDLVKGAILKKGAVAICVSQFSLAAEQTVGHALLTDEKSIDLYADYIEGQPRFSWASTEIADGLILTENIMAQSPYDRNAESRVIDISGDGEQSITGYTSRKADNEMLRLVSDNVSVDHRVTINGLSIMTDIPDLDEYYKECVVTSEDAWNRSGYISKGRVWSITNYRHFEVAMKNKLSSEFANNEYNDYGNPKQNGQILRFA